MELRRYQVIEHITRAYATQGTIEVAMKSDFYYGPPTRYRDFEGELTIYFNYGLSL